MSLVPREEPWYRQPSFISFIKSTAINFVLPFINGVMLGFGEIFANELVIKYGWFGYSNNVAVSFVGLRSSIPPGATAEYKKSMETELRRQERNN
ncbi:unnamed protein product [Cunninghamella blakesleeana]